MSGESAKVNTFKNKCTLCSFRCSNRWYQRSTAGFTLGTAACRAIFLTGSGAVLSMDATITSTSGLPAGQSVAKCSRTRTPFLSYAVTGHTWPKIQHTKGERNIVTSLKSSQIHNHLLPSMYSALKANFDTCPFFLSHMLWQLHLFTNKTKSSPSIFFSLIQFASITTKWQ